jgi:hypothetical protein
MEDRKEVTASFIKLPSRKQKRARVVVAKSQPQVDCNFKICSQDVSQTISAKKAFH